MPSNSVGGVSVTVRLDDKDALQQLERLRRKIQQTQDDLSRKRAQRDAISAEMEQAELATERARQKVEQLKEALAKAAPSDRAGIRAQLTEANAELRQQMSTMDRLNRQWQKLDSDITAGEGNLRRMTTDADTLGRQVRSSSGAFAHLHDSARKAAAGMSKAFARVGRMIRRVFVFTVILRALRALREALSNLLLSFPEIREALSDIKSNLLTAFTPLFNTLMPLLQGFLNLLVKISAVVADIVARLFGTSAAAAQDNAKALSEQAAAYKATGTAAAKAEKQLASFDQINKLEKNSSGGSATAPTFSSDFSKAWDRLFGDLDFSAIQNALDRLHESFDGLTEIIGGGLRQVWNEVLNPLGTWTIEQAAPRLISLLATGFDFLRAVLEKLAPILAPVWEKLLKPLFVALGKIVLKGLDGLIDLLGDLVDLIDGDISWSEFIGGLDGIQIALLSLGGLAVLNAIGSVVSGIASIPKTLAKSIPAAAANLAKLAKVMATGMLAVFDGIMIAYDVKSLKEASDTYLAAQEAINRDIDTAMRAYAAIYEKKGKEAADAFALATYHIDLSGYSFLEAQQKLAESIEAEYADIPRNLWQGFKAGWNEYFGENGRGLLALLSDAFNSAVDGIKKLLGIQSPSTVFEDIGANVAQGLWNGFSNTWDKFSDWLSDAWDGVAKWWDGLSLNFERGDGTITASSSKIRDKIPKIPLLAQGAVIPPNREFMAVLGDQPSGTNIEAPLDTIVQAFRQALSERGGTGSRTVVLQVDKHELGRVTFDAYNTESQRVGLKLGGSLT